MLVTFLSLIYKSPLLLYEIYIVTPEGSPVEAGNILKLNLIKHSMVLSSQPGSGMKI